MQGYARCGNRDCTMFDDLVEVPFERHTKSIRAESLPITITETQYDIFTDGAETCPACGESRALLTGRPAKIPKYA